ncbi:MAG: hypothetical protein M1821_004019 [Bathelium mastoideum]|nr:MAG: hypothetical protein M1821_004019 [Bathelium mastoideum]
MANPNLLVSSGHEGLQYSQLVALDESVAEQKSSEESMSEDFTLSTGVETPFSPTTKRVMTANAVATSKTPISLPYGRGLIERPASSGNDLGMGFKFGQPTKQKPDFSGYRKDLAVSKSQQNAQQAQSAGPLKKSPEPSQVPLFVTQETEAPKTMSDRHSQKASNTNLRSGFEEAQVQYKDRPDSAGGIFHTTDHTSQINDTGDIEHTSAEHVHHIIGDKARYQPNAQQDTQTIKGSGPDCLAGSPNASDAIVQPTAVRSHERCGTLFQDPEIASPRPRPRADAKALKIPLPKWGQRMSWESTETARVPESEAAGTGHATNAPYRGENHVHAAHSVNASDSRLPLQNPPAQKSSDLEEEVRIAPIKQAADKNLSVKNEEEPAAPDKGATSELDKAFRESNSPMLMEAGLEAQSSESLAGDRQAQEAPMQARLRPSPTADPSSFSVELSNDQATSTCLRKISSRDGRTKVVKPLTRESDGHPTRPTHTRLNSPKSMRPAGMPVAGTLDIIQMLQRRLHQDEQQANEALVRSKQDSLEQIRSLQHAQSITGSTLEVLKSEKEHLLAKTQHDQQQIQNLRKRSAVLENFVNGFSSDFNRLKEDILKAEAMCTQLVEDKARHDHERNRLTEHFNTNLQRSESLNSEAKGLIAVLQARLQQATKHNERLESDLNEKVGMLSEERDNRMQLQKFLEAVKDLSEKSKESMQSDYQTVVQKLEDLRNCVKTANADEATNTIISDCVKQIQALKGDKDTALLHIKDVHGVVNELSERLEELGKAVEGSHLVASSLKPELLRELASLRALVDQVATLGQQNTALRESKSVLDQKLSNSEISVSELRQELEKLRASETTLKEQVVELETRAKAETEGQDQWHAVVDSLHDLQAHKEDLTVQLEKAKAQVNEATTKLAQAAILEQDLRSQAGDLDAKVKESRAAADSLKSERDEVERKAVQNLETVRRDLREETHKLCQAQAASYENSLLQARDRQHDLEAKLRERTRNEPTATQVESLLQQVECKHQEIARLKASHKKFCEKIQQLLQATRLDNLDSPSLKGLENELEALDSHFCLEDDLLLGGDLGWQCTSQELESLRTQYQAVQTTNKNNLNHIEQLSKKLTEMDKIRSQENRDLKLARKQAEDTGIKREQELHAVLASQRKDHDELVGNLVGKHEAEKAVLHEGLHKAKAQIELFRKNYNLEVNEDFQAIAAIPETQSTVAQQKSQPMPSTDQQCDPQQSKQLIVSPGRLSHQARCSADSNRLSQDTGSTSLQAGARENHSLTKIPFRVYEESGVSELARLETLDDNSISLRQSHVDKVSLPTCGSFLEIRPHSSSMLSDASPSTPDPIQDLATQPSRNNEMQVALNKRLPSQPDSRSAHTGYTSMSRTQKDSIQKTLARPNTGSKVARHQTPCETQEGRETRGQGHFFGRERDDRELSLLLGLTDVESVQPGAQQPPLHTAQVPRAASQSTGSSDGPRQLNPTSPHMSSRRQVQSVRNQGNDQNEPRTPTAQTGLANHQVRNSPSMLTTFDNLSPKHTVRKDSGGTRKRQAASVLDKDQEQPSKRNKSYPKSPLKNHYLTRSSTSRQKSAAMNASNIGTRQDTQIKESKAQNQGIYVKQVEAQNQQPTARDLGRQSQDSSKVENAKSQSQGKDDPQIKFSQSQRSQDKTSDSQHQSQPSGESAIPSQSRMRSSGRNSQNSTGRSSQRQKKNKSSYQQTRFSQEFLGR